MKATGLLARAIYTALALLLFGAGTFYACMQVLPQFADSYPRLDPAGDGAVIFKISICAAVGVAFSTGLVALTLPWLRHRRRSGRGLRIAVSAVAVVLCSAAFAAEGYGLVVDLLFVGWLTYTLAFTFVRYGILDRARNPSRSSKEYY